MYVFNNFIWIHFLSYIQLKIIALKLVRAITAHIRKESKMVENVAKFSTKYNGIKFVKQAIKVALPHGVFFQIIGGT